MAQGSKESRLIVLGAGPKAIAITAKSAVLKDLGWSVPNIVVLEKNNVAAHWSGEYGFTDGKQLLGTPPEKDIGFPYVSTCWWLSNETVNENIIPIEIKYGKVDLKGTLFFMDKYKVPQGKIITSYQQEEKEINGKKITLIPAYAYFLQ